MQLYDLNPNILFSIFVSVDISQAITKQYIQWHHGLDPSFNLLKTLINQYLHNDNNSYLKAAAKNCLQIISKLMVLKYPRNLIRAFLSVIKQNRVQIDEYLEMREIVDNWKNISIDLLEYYLQGFQIQIIKQENKANQFSLPIQIIKKRVYQLIDNKQYDSAIQLIKILAYPQELLKELFQKMANSKQASKAANFMKTHKINHNLYPQIGERLNKNMIRHFLKSQGWQSVEQIFYENNQALACLIQDLIFKQKKRQAISIWWRHHQLKNYIIKKQSLQFIKQIQNLSTQQIQKDILNNSYFIDYFGPSDKQKYLTLQQYGIGQKNVICIDNNQCKQMDLLINALNQSKILAIDTESIVGKTKLQRNKHQPVSIVQIAFQKNIFVLDGISCRSQKLKMAFVQYNKAQNLILGHALDNDMDGFYLAMGFEQKELKEIKIQKQIDTCKLFKSIYPNQKFSNLAYICLKVLGKEVCKKQTLTNWNRRPLRANQLHYAAMDAFCVLKIYEKLLEQVGQNMLSYFIQEM